MNQITEIQWDKLKFIPERDKQFLPKRKLKFYLPLKGGTGNTNF